MTQTILLLVAIILVARLLRTVLNSNTKKAMLNGSARFKGAQYPAVSVLVSPTCCQSAELLKGLRYMAEEAPPLPLPDCTNAKCHCIYVHHSDRRSGTWSRRQTNGLQSNDLLMAEEEDRRESWGRRARDFAAKYRPTSSLTTQSL
jgi:hypothetical protein